jgi:hypothetical protein
MLHASQSVKTQPTMLDSADAKISIPPPMLRSALPALHALHPVKLQLVMLDFADAER